jgi:hypothetical protein
MISKAHIYSLESQAQIAEDLGRLLKCHVYDQISVQQHFISNQYSRSPRPTDHENCRAFLKLFKASMISVDDFAIVVTDGQGRWYYMGDYYYNEPYLLELLQSAMTSLFPAVAIMNRMVLLPHDVGEAFEKSRVFPWFVRPRDLAGVALADFRHADSIEDAVRQVGAQLKNDIAKLCKRHMLFRKIASPDFHELERLLGVSKDYLERHRADLISPSANLRARIVSGAARLGKSSRIVLEVDYEPEHLSGTVIVKVTAPSGVLDLPVAATLDLSNGLRTQLLEFKVTTKTGPYCPLEVQYLMDDTLAVSAPFPLPLVLEVEP